MLTLRVIPPRLLNFTLDLHSRDIAALYFDNLWRHWRPLDKAVALGLSGVASIRNLSAAIVTRHAWRQGWDAREQALLGAASDYDAHLSMAARKGLHRLINPGAFPLAENPLKNKRLFAERCRAAGLPIPADYSGSADGLGAWLEGERHVIVKPNYASKGDGVVAYGRCGDGWSSAGVKLTSAEVERRIARALSASGVVQRALPAHPALGPLSPGALPTLRVMTAVNERGELEACDRMLRFSAGGPRPVDNFNAANFVAGVCSDGRVRRAYRRVGGAIQMVDRHPVSDVVIRGWPVPDLDAAIALALKAHEAFREGFSVIGWDIGLTDQGPVLIEGNWNPGTDIVQLVSGRGVGDGRLGAIYRWRLSKLTAEDWRRCRPIELEPRNGARLGLIG